jgi:putative endonuclease
MERQPAVYILTNHHTGTLYIGVTSDLPRRIWQHRSDLVEGFTRDYALHRLVWFEMHATMYAAISREKQLKKWNREWKVDLDSRDQSAVARSVDGYLRKLRRRFSTATSTRMDPRVREDDDKDKDPLPRGRGEPSTSVTLADAGAHPDSSPSRTRG